jgi:hypothetical protein
MLEEVVIALSSSVNNLGLCGCHFSRYEEMVSFVRAFPHCNTLYIEDCVTGGQDSPINLFSGLPQHKLSIIDLGLTASSTSDLLIDPSGLTEDAELDVSSLSKLGCDLRSVEGIRRILSATSESPVRGLRFSATCTDGFQGTPGSRFSTSVKPTAHGHHHSVRNFGAASMAPGVVDDWTGVPCSGRRVLAYRIQKLPCAPSLDRSPDHLP